MEPICKLTNSVLYIVALNCLLPVFKIGDVTLSGDGTPDYTVYVESMNVSVATIAESTDTPGEWIVTVISEDVTYVYICVYSEDGDIIVDDTVSIVVTTVGSGEENENTNP